MGRIGRNEWMTSKALPRLKDNDAGHPNMPTRPTPTIALLLSGGAGTRLWPISRQALPKQFLKLFGENSLYQLTLKRLIAAQVDAIAVVANAAHRHLLEEQAAEIGAEAPILLLEPDRRDSGPAIASGVAYAHERFGEDAIICAMPCDHLIPDTTAFALALNKAITVAKSDALVTFGIQPTYPSTEFGYLQQGAAHAAGHDALIVDRFHEKPKLEVAIRYLADGGFSWNSGMFVFAAKTFASEAERYMPQIWSGASLAVKQSLRCGGIITLAAEPFLAIAANSIDFALMELSRKVAMVPTHFAWSDVGTWGSAFEVIAKDKNGNAVVGEVTLEDSKGNMVIGDGVRVIALGVSNLAIIAHPEGVFVGPLHRAAALKELIKK